MFNGKERVIIPLQYDKLYSFKTSFSGDKKFTLEQNSFLSVYKDASGSFHAEVVTTYPGETYLNNVNQDYQGLLTIDDWNENRIKTYLYKDGKLYSIQSANINTTDYLNGRSNRTTEICMTVYWWWCEGWESNLSQCSYIGFTTYENCADFQSLQPPAEGGEYAYEYDVAKNTSWEVYNTTGPGSAYISADEKIKGKRSSRYPTGGYFTLIQHLGSWCYCPQNSVWGENNNSKVELIGSGMWAESKVEGTYPYQGVSILVSNTKRWAFNDLW